MSAVAGVDTFDKGILAGVVGIDYRIDTCAVKCNGVNRRKDSEVGHFGRFRVAVAVAVYRQFVCHVDIENLVAHVRCYSLTSICHGFKEMVLLGKIVPKFIGIFGFTGGVNPCFTGGRANAYGYVFQGSTEAAHLMSFEV